MCFPSGYNHLLIVWLYTIHLIAFDLISLTAKWDSGSSYLIGLLRRLNDIIYNVYKIYLCLCMCVKSLQLCLSLCDPMDCTCQASLSMGFPRQEYWSWVPLPSLDISDTLSNCSTPSFPTVSTSLFKSMSLFLPCK